MHISTSCHPEGRESLDRVCLCVQIIFGGSKHKEFLHLCTTKTCWRIFLGLDLKFPPKSCFRALFQFSLSGSDTTNIDNYLVNP